MAIVTALQWQSVFGVAYLHTVIIIIIIIIYSLFKVDNRNSVQCKTETLIKRYKNTLGCRRKSKCLANAKRPCDCRVLCLRLKSSLHSCAHSISDMTSFGCREQGRDRQCAPSALNVNVKKFKKARVNGGGNYGNQTISSTRPSCWIQISTVDAINIAADHQMFMILTGELSWQRLRRSISIS